MAPSLITAERDPSGMMLEPLTVHNIYPPLSPNSQTKRRALISIGKTGHKTAFFADDMLKIYSQLLAYHLNMTKTQTQTTYCSPSTVLI